MRHLRSLRYYLKAFGEKHNEKIVFALQVFGTALWGWCCFRVLYTPIIKHVFWPWTPWFMLSVVLSWGLLNLMNDRLHNQRRKLLIKHGKLLDEWQTDQRVTMVCNAMMADSLVRFDPKFKNRNHVLDLFIGRARAVVREMEKESAPTKRNQEPPEGVPLVFQ